MRTIIKASELETIGMREKKEENTERAIKCPRCGMDTFMLKPHMESVLAWCYECLHMEDTDDIDEKTLLHLKGGQN